MPVPLSRYPVQGRDHVELEKWQILWSGHENVLSVVPASLDAGVEEGVQAVVEGGLAGRGREGTVLGALHTEVDLIPVPLRQCLAPVGHDHVGREQWRV